MYFPVNLLFSYQWIKVDSNHQNPKAPDLQSGPLPITVYSSKWGIGPIAAIFIAACVPLLGCFLLLFSHTCSCFYRGSSDTMVFSRKPIKIK